MVINFGQLRRNGASNQGFVFQLLTSGYYSHAIAGGFELVLFTAYFYGRGHVFSSLFLYLFFNLVVPLRRLQHQSAKRLKRCDLL